MENEWLIGTRYLSTMLSTVRMVEKVFSTERLGLKLLTIELLLACISDVRTRTTVLEVLNSTAPIDLEMTNTVRQDLRILVHHVGISRARPCVFDRLRSFRWKYTLRPAVLEALLAEPVGSSVYFTTSILSNYISFFVVGVNPVIQSMAVVQKIKEEWEAFQP